MDFLTGIGAGALAVAFATWIAPVNADEAALGSFVMGILFFVGALVLDHLGVNPTSRR